MNTNIKAKLRLEKYHRKFFAPLYSCLPFLKNLDPRKTTEIHVRKHFKTHSVKLHPEGLGSLCLFLQDRVKTFPGKDTGRSI